MNVKLMINLLFLVFSFIIAPDSLLKIKLKFLIIYFNGSTSIFILIKEFYIRLYTLKSPKKII